MILWLRGPRSLLWRLGVLALAVTVVSLVLHLTVISVWIRPVLDKLIGQMVARATITRTLIQQTPDAQRDQVARGLSDLEFMLGRGAANRPAMLQPPVPMGPALSKRLGSGFDVWVESDDVWPLEPRQLWIGFEVDHQPWQIRVLAQPPIWAVLGTGIGWLVLAAAALAASFLVGLRFIVGPIRQVAQRIASQGAELAPVPVPSGSSTEVRSLVDSFNRLVEKVRTADRTKQHLLAGVSHDLRTPLSRLRLRIETQCEPRVAADAEEELQAVEHIVAQFLAYVHGESGAGMGARQSVLLIADQVVDSYARQGVDIAVVIAAPDASVGQVSVQRLLTNLIDNALTHGAQPIEISWRAPSPDTRELGVWTVAADWTRPSSRPLSSLSCACPKMPRSAIAASALRSWRRLRASGRPRWPVGAMATGASAP